MRIHYTNSIVQILLCKFLRADSIVRIPSCGFHHTCSIVQLPLCGFHHTGSIVRIACGFDGFHPVHSNVRVPLCAYRSIVRIPSCAFNCVHSIVCIPPSCNRRRKEEVKEDGGWVHWRIVFTFVFALPLASTGMHPLKVYWVRAHRLGVHQPDCSRLLDLDFSQRLLLE